MSGITDIMTGPVGNIVMIVLKVPNKLLAVRVVRTMRASAALETKFVIYLVSLDVSRDSHGFSISNFFVQPLFENM